MSEGIKDVQARIVRQALSGRLPLRSNERIYNNYSSFMWTCCAFSAATWAFLIGGYLPYVGDTRIGIAGYLVGLLIGMSLVTLASAVPSHKYGIDTIDAAKSSFGVYGIILPLFGLLATLVGWTFVVVALTSRGAANVVATIQQSANEPSEGLVVVFALASIALVWLIASRGPWLFERLSNYIGPGHMLVTAAMLGILLYHHGLNVFALDVPKEEALVDTKLKGFALAVEFGFSNALTWWPVMGGLSRLVNRRRHIMGPSVVGVGVLGAAFISMVAALAAVAAGTPDPTIWMIKLGGPVFGTIIMTFVLLANVATMVIMIYLAGVSIQQLRLLTRLRWDVLIALMLLPGVYFSFHTGWLLSSVMSWLSINGVMFVGITGITLVDYYILRSENLNPTHLFSRSSTSVYWFWGGVNWIAVVISLGAIGFYLWLYDPVTASMNQYAGYLGAGIPTLVLAAILYFLAMKLLVIPSRVGGYNPDPKEDVPSLVPAL